MSRRERTKRTVAVRDDQCGRLTLSGRCRRPAAVHGYCVPCWNLGVQRLGSRRR